MNKEYKEYRCVTYYHSVAAFGVKYRDMDEIMKDINELAKEGFEIERVIDSSRIDKNKTQVMFILSRDVK